MTVRRFAIASRRMTHIAIVDSACPRPYSATSLINGALGGTEASIVRIAEALDAQVYQRGREHAESRYHPMASLHDPSVLIVLRDPKLAAELSLRFPGVPIFVWMHDLIESGKDRAARLIHYSDQLVRAGAVVVAVSDFHRKQIEAVLASAEGSRKGAGLRVARIYNPVAGDLPRGHLANVDIDQLIFFSAATKGLDFAIFSFRALRRRWPTLRLVVANPGYASVATRRVDGVVDIGALSQREVLARVATSLCAFCPNFELAETFGLVLAESNAVGTPVMALDHGAASEVLGDHRQIVELPRLASLAYRASQRVGAGHAISAALVDHVGGFATFTERLEEWRTGGRPHVEARAEFSIANVVAGWRTLLCKGAPDQLVKADDSLCPGVGA